MADLKVVPLPPPTDATAALVATLEALLDQAKDGNVESFLFVGMRRDGGALSARSFEPGAQRYALIGAIENRLRVLHRLLEQDEQTEVTFSTNPEPA